MNRWNFDTIYKHDIRTAPTRFEAVDTNGRNSIYVNGTDSMRDDMHTHALCRVVDGGSDHKRGAFLPPPIYRADYREGIQDVHRRGSPLALPPILPSRFPRNRSTAPVLPGMQPTTIESSHEKCRWNTISESVLACDVRETKQDVAASQQARVLQPASIPHAHPVARSSVIWRTMAPISPNWSITAAATNCPSNTQLIALPRPKRGATNVTDST